MLFSKEAAIASNVYKKTCSELKESVEYGEFWVKYWSKDKDKFLDTELYLSFFDHERWKIKEFYDHNNPFDIKYSKGNFQAQDNLIRALSALSQTILSGYFKTNPFEANNILLRLFHDLYSQLPWPFPGDAQYPLYYDDTRIVMHESHENKQFSTSKFGNRDTYNFYAFILTHFALNKSLDINNNFKSIVEIGGGYGGLACLNVLHNNHIKYTLVDLPEASSIQLFVMLSLQNILKCDIEFIVSENHIENYSYFDNNQASNKLVRIIPAHNFKGKQLENSSHGCNAVLNFKSMMEMPDSEINRYFDFINRLPPESFFICTNRYRKISKLIDYPFNENWQFKYSYSYTLMPWHHDLVLQKTTEPDISFPEEYSDRISYFDYLFSDQNKIPNLESMINTLT